MLGPTLVVAAAGGLAFLAYDTYGRGNLEAVTSKVDGRHYDVQALPDKQAAADLLARIAANLATLVRHIEKTQADDPRTLRMVQKFDARRISEEPAGNKFTSYSVNKGERVVLCLRSRDDERALADLNTMTFVAIHELAHICTEELGHPPTFWANFKWLLVDAVNTGIYKDRDYKKKPQTYCGIEITDSPLHGKA
jgi:hypothetical protein